MKNETDVLAGSYVNFLLTLKDDNGNFWDPDPEDCSIESIFDEVIKLEISYVRKRQQIFKKRISPGLWFAIF